MSDELPTWRETLELADRLIEQGFQSMLDDGITIEIATKRIMGPVIAANVEIDQQFFDAGPIGCWLDFATIDANGLHLLGQANRVKPEKTDIRHNGQYDSLRVGVARGCPPGSAARLEALAGAYEWREWLGDDSSPFTLSDNQIAQWAAETFTHNAKYSKDTTISPRPRRKNLAP